MDFKRPAGVPFVVREHMSQCNARYRYGNLTRFESAAIRLVPSATTQNAGETLLANIGIDASAHTQRRVTK